MNVTGQHQPEQPPVPPMVPIPGNGDLLSEADMSVRRAAGVGLIMRHVHGEFVEATGVVTKRAGPTPHPAIRFLYCGNLAQRGDPGVT
jgi:hypothetical protein